MLTKRIIATVLVNNGNVIQSRQFKHTNVIGNVKTVIDFFDQWDADEIIILDVSKEKDPNFLKTVEEASEKCFVPMAVGGWIRSLDDIRDALNAGADKIVINTEASNRPEFISEAANIFGSQCVIVSIDYKERGIFVDRGKKLTNSLNLLGEYARHIERSGAGEIYLTNIDNDGIGRGYDLRTLMNMVDTVSIPVIASGGCGNWRHLADAFDVGADACSIGNRLHFSEHSIKEAKKYLIERGYPIRPIGKQVSETMIEEIREISNVLDSLDENSLTDGKKKNRTKENFR